MKPTGLHLLLTYQCTLECDHCFVWGSPRQTGTLSLAEIRRILHQAQAVPSITSIYFEGGEPFLYYAVLLQAVREAAALGYTVGLVTNAYWATTAEDARACLEPLAGLISDLSISSDRYHSDDFSQRKAQHASAAARRLGIPVSILRVAQPDQVDAACVIGQLPDGESRIMYRGRAVVQLAGKASTHPWDSFTACPFEDLREPERLHLDPFGHLHLCQGISLGNIFHTPLTEICTRYDPATHPITGPLLNGGPAELVRQYGLAHEPGYADACHLCYAARTLLRGSFLDTLVPDQMYGVVNG